MGIFFLFYCSTNPLKLGIVLPCFFSLLCNPDAISLCCIAYHMKHVFLSPVLKPLFELYDMVIPFLREEGEKTDLSDMFVIKIYHY